MVLFVLAAMLVIAGVAYAILTAVTVSRKEADAAGTLQSLPPTMQVAVAQLPGQLQSAFFREYELKRRNTGTSYLLWLLFGVHYFYNRKPIHQLLYWSSVGGFGIWAIVDLFRMPSIVRESNEEAARSALQVLSFATQLADPRSTPISRTPAAPYQVGDIVNGHRFDGTAWRPLDS